MVEPLGPGVLDGERAAEADAAVDAQALAARERQVQQRQEVLVPAHGDAVLGDAAEPLEHPFVERLVDLAPLRNRLRRRIRGAGQSLRQRLDLEPIDCHHAEALVEEVVRQRVSGGPQPDDEHIAPVVGERVRTPHVQRIPARQQLVDFHPPRHVEHVGQHAGLGLRDVDRLLLLVDAALHAVVADAVAGAGAHRVVDGHDGERANRIAVLPDDVHLRDLLVERAAVQRDPEWVGRDLPLLVTQPLRAGILFALVADDAVVDLAQVLARRAARVGQREPVPAPQALVGTKHCLGQVRARALHLHEVVVVDRLGELEDHPRPIGGIVQMCRAPALQRVGLRGKRGLLVLGGPGGARQGLAVHQRVARVRHRQLLVEMRPRADEFLNQAQVAGLDMHMLPALDERQRPFADKVDLEAEEGVELLRLRVEAPNGILHPEQLRDEATHMRRHPHEEV